MTFTPALLASWVSSTRQTGLEDETKKLTQCWQEPKESILVPLLSDVKDVIQPNLTRYSVLLQESVKAEAATQRLSRYSPP